MGKCTNEYGREVDGLTYEGELNKVIITVVFVGVREWNVLLIGYEAQFPQPV